MSKYWLIKSEPDAYSWETLTREGKTDWTGVRNFAARNHLKAMKKGDEVLFYHSGEGKNIVGLAVVTKEHFKDRTAKEGDWYAVEVAPVASLEKPIPLSELKQDKLLKNMKVVTISRLSVSPVTDAEFKKVCDLGELRRLKK